MWKMLGQESCRTKVSRILRIFVPNFAPNFAFTEFFEDFSCFVSWETETRKNSPKIPAIFQCKIPRQTRKKNIHKIFLESRQSKKMFTFPLTPEKHGFEEIPQNESAENAERLTPLLGPRPRSECTKMAPFSEVVAIFRRSPQGRATS